MLGYGPLASLAISDALDSFARASAFTSLLTDPSAPRMHLLEFAPINPATGLPEPLYICDTRYATSPTDTPPNRQYMPRAITVLRFRQSIPLERLFGQLTELEPGEISIANTAPDGGTGDLDYLLDYAWDGTPVTVKMGPPSPIVGPSTPYDEFGIIYQGIIQTAPEATTKQFTLRPRDARELLNRPVQQATYAGTGPLAAPTLHATGHNSGGFLGVGTYFFVITTIDEVGESLPSAPVSVTFAAGTTNRVDFTWNKIVAGRGYRVYGRPGTSGGTYGRLQQINAVETLTWIDDGLTAPGVPPPTVNTGIDEGTVALKGFKKPQCWGRLLNITLVPVNPALGLYQFHGLTSFPAKNLTALYENAVLLNLVGSSPGLGEYTKDMVRGTITLGFTPIGIITGDVDGAPADDPGFYLAPLVLKAMLAQQFPEVARDDGTFLREARHQLYGVYITGDESGTDVLTQGLVGQGSVPGFDRFGQLQVLTVDVGRTPIKSYGVDEIISVEKLAAPNPTWRMRWGYDHNWTVMTPNDIADSVDATREAALGLPELIYDETTDASVKTLHPLPEDPGVISTLGGLNFPDWLRIFAMLKEQRGFYRVKVLRRPFAVGLTSPIGITYARFNLAGGKRVTVLALEEDTKGPVVTYDVFG